MPIMLSFLPVMVFVAPVMVLLQLGAAGFCRQFRIFGRFSLFVFASAHGPRYRLRVFRQGAARIHGHFDGAAVGRNLRVSWEGLFRSGERVVDPRVFVKINTLVGNLGVTGGDCAGRGHVDDLRGDRRIAREEVL